MSGQAGDAGRRDQGAPGPGSGAPFEPSEESPLPLPARPPAPRGPQYESFEGDGWVPQLDPKASKPTPTRPATGRIERPSPPIASAPVASAPINTLPILNPATGRFEPAGAPPASAPPRPEKPATGRFERPTTMPASALPSTTRPATGRFERPPASTATTAPMPAVTPSKPTTGRFARPPVVAIVAQRPLRDPFESVPAGPPLPEGPKIIIPLADSDVGRVADEGSTDPLLQVPEPRPSRRIEVDLTKTENVSEASFGSMVTSESAPGGSGSTRLSTSAPFGLDSGTGELRWTDPVGSSEEAVMFPRPAPSGIGSSDGAGGGVSGDGPLVLDPGRGTSPDEDSASDAKAFESSRVQAIGGGHGGPSMGEGFARRTAEVDDPAARPGALTERVRSRLFEDSDLTPIAQLQGSDEGPIDGLLDSSPDRGWPRGPVDGPGVALESSAQGSLSQRMVRLSVERVVGLWEGETAWLLVSAGGALVGPLALAIGASYYALGKEARLDHPFHALLRPSGSWGLGFGIAAAVLFLLNLTYVLRRRMGLMKGWISLRVWLNVHFICGLTGGSLVLAHSALLLNNPVATACSVAIAGVVTSGVFGRYVLTHLPRRGDGEKADLADRADVAQRLTELRKQLRARLEQAPALRDAALAAIGVGHGGQSNGVGHGGQSKSVQSPLETMRLERQAPRGLRYVLPMLASDVAAAWRWARLKWRLEGLVRRSGDPALRKIVNETLALARVQRLEQRLLEADAVQDLMDTWRGVHFVLALVVIVTMVLHVIIVTTYSTRPIW